MSWDDIREVSELLGKTLIDIAITDNRDEIYFTLDDGNKYVMRHDQDCCESVTVEDIIGDLQDLIGSPILMAEEVIHKDETPDGAPPKVHDDSYTWTFYKFATMKGYVTLRWYGESNGYYSEEVDFRKMD